MREAIELEHPSRARAVEWLVEAARFERDAQKDLLAAERHLAVALRLAPHDEAIGAGYREIATAIALRRARDSEVAS
jgi:hypothetical protein